MGELHRGCCFFVVLCIPKQFKFWSKVSEMVVTVFGAQQYWDMSVRFVVGPIKISDTIGTHVRALGCDLFSE